MGEADRRQKALELLAELGEAHGAPGDEGDVRRIFRRELGDGAETDRTGNIFCEVKGAAASPRIMVAAHMDEVAMVVQSVTKAGLIKFSPLGGWWAHTLLAQRVRIRTRSGRDVTGVVGAKPPHFLEEGERDKVVKLDKMFVDVGASSAHEVREGFGVRLGDTIVPASAFTPLENPDLLLCKAFDNRAGMALVIQLALELRRQAAPCPGTVFSVGTVQEELGARGAQTAVFGLSPDVAIVLEGTPADDLPEVSEEERQGALGKGVQIRLLDPSAILNRRFNDFVLELAKERQIPHQVAVRKSGATDARPIHLHGTGVPTVVLGVAARYIHTHNTIIDVNDYLSTLELLLHLVRRLDQTACQGFAAYED